MLIIDQYNFQSYRFAVCTWPSAGKLLNPSIQNDILSYPIPVAGGNLPEGGQMIARCVQTVVIYLWLYDKEFVNLNIDMMLNVVFCSSSSSGCLVTNEDPGDGHPQCSVYCRCLVWTLFEVPNTMMGPSMLDYFFSLVKMLGALQDFDALNWNIEFCCGIISSVSRIVCLWMCALTNNALLCVKVNMTEDGLSFFIINQWYSSKSYHA